MNVSVVLRLVAERLAEGEIVGRAHIVDTGEDRLVANVTELMAFLRSGVAPPDAEAATQHDA